MELTSRLWDLIAGREHSILTNHKTAVRSVCIHDKEYAFASASTDNIKKWALPDGYFANNFAGHKAVINSLALAYVYLYFIYTLYIHYIYNRY